MDIRVDKVTRMPGWIKSGSTYTFILKGDKLYMLRTGKYVDFEMVAPFVGGGLEGYVAGKISGKLIDSMYAGRLKEIEEVEGNIKNETLDEMSKPRILL